MGRNKKIGLDYFPFDIDFFQDLKIRKLIKYQGGKAITVYALLLCNIYKQGYYMRWDEELPFIVSEQTGFEEAYIREVIKCCLVIGLFSKDLYESENILTSKGIQERYQKICDLCRRNNEMLEYNIISSEDIDISSEEKPVSSEEKQISSAKSTQSKVNRNKTKENSTKVEQKKVKVDKDAAKAATLARRNSFYDSLIPFINQYSKEMIHAFFDYWSELNKSGTKMRYELEKTWELPRRLVTWANREKNFVKREPKPSLQSNDDREYEMKERFKKYDEWARKAVTYEEYKNNEKNNDLLGNKE